MLVYGKYESSVMQMLYVSVLCVSNGISEKNMYYMEHAQFLIHTLHWG